MTFEQTLAQLQDRLSETMPRAEIELKARTAHQINVLKKEKNAVILGHNYMEPALYYSIPDYRGDSLELARRAAAADKDIILFCGVRFMAETAKLLSPSKTVLLPTEHGGCSLAASLTGEDVRNLKRQFPGVPVVTYVNTYADVKAESDICCTSSNAVQVVESFDSDTILFLPDEYLAKNVARETGKRLIFPSKTQGNGGSGLDYQLIGWHGKCEVHDKFTVEDIDNVRKQFPDVVILAHPECPPEVVEASDFSGSTSAMVRYVEEEDAPRYLLLTECSMGDNIAAANKDKEMLRLCSVRCPHMNEITLEDTLDALTHDRYVIEIDEAIRVKAARAVERMVQVG